jgi:hypothetical protein
MARTGLALLLGVVLLLPTSVSAADDALAGNWKVSVVGQGKESVIWLLKIDQKDGKWGGTLLDTSEDFYDTQFDTLTVTGDVLRFKGTLKTEEGTARWNCEAKLPKDTAKIGRGSLVIGESVFPCELEPTTLTKIDRFELSKELLARSPNDPRVLRAVLGLLSQAAVRKVKPEEVRGWAEKALKAAEPYGVRLQREIAVHIAGTLAEQEGFGAIAVAYAQRAERMLEPKDEPGAHLRVLTVLSAALKKAGKGDQAKELAPRIAKYEKEEKAWQAKLAKERRAEEELKEAKVDEEYLKTMPPFKPEPFAGRMAKSDRTILAELFTGAQCPPCAAADLAFDALLKTFKPTDVVLIQYHLHVPRPDPLTSPAANTRLDFYGDEVEGTPTILFNGKPESVGGGFIKDSQKVYNAWLKTLTPLLEKPATVRLKATALKKGETIAITAEANDLEKPGEDVRLRLVLVEDRVRFAGSNGIRFHHHIVRAFPGGEKGLALKAKSGKQTASVNLEELRKDLAKYMTEYAAKARVEFPDPEKVLDLKNLRVVAFVQNDKTKEVLQAVQVDVGGGKE